HHLKNEWWHTLNKVKEKLDPVIVGLTATPPYDVTATEWQRYINLNGPVDTEISVPELVIAGDLCPHQDYVYFTWPIRNENRSIVYVSQNMENLFLEIKSDETIIQDIAQQPSWQNPEALLFWMYHNLASDSPCLVFRHPNHRACATTLLEAL